jgi:hypothetical protein
VTPFARRHRGTSRVPLPYSAAQADRTLPLVRRIVRDLTEHHARWQDAVSGFEYATVGSLADKPDADAERFQSAAQLLAREIEGFLAELDSLGVECRDPARGIVAFPGERDGCAVYFPWEPGASTVSGPASANGTSISDPSRPHDAAANTSLASRSRSDGSRE